MSNKTAKSLTAVRPVVGVTPRDVGAEHCADSWVWSETPREFLAIWIPTIVLSQVPRKQRMSSCNLLRWKFPLVDGWVCLLMRVSDSLARVSLRHKCVVMGILRIPALAHDSTGGHVYCPPVTLSSALVTFGCFHHRTLRRFFCKRIAKCWVCQRIPVANLHAATCSDNQHKDLQNLE